MPSLFSLPAFAGCAKTAALATRITATTPIPRAEVGAKEVWPGAFAEYMLTMENTLFHKPAALSFDVACLPTEPLSGAWKGMIQYSQLQVGEDVVVIGVGSIGLMCLLVARAAGASRLIAVDTSPHARQKALQLGATHAVDPSDPAVRENLCHLARRARPGHRSGRTD